MLQAPRFETPVERFILQDYPIFYKSVLFVKAQTLLILQCKVNLEVFVNLP